MCEGVVKLGQKVPSFGIETYDPSKWKEEGDKTLAPSAKMVGRVHEALQIFQDPPGQGSQKQNGITG